jgi:two-component system sensor histidine kinase CpxA
MFRRILLWFAGISLFSLLAFIFTTVWNAPRTPFGGDFGGRMMTFQMDEAVRAFQASGPQGLAALLAQYDQAFGARHHLLDAAGRDLVTGEIYPESARIEARRPRIPFLPFRPPPVPMYRRSADGQYGFLIIVQALPPNPWANLPIFGWILVAVVGLVYVLAVQLARPVRSLRETVLRFGHGDLSARTGSTRRDEIGDLQRAFDEMAARIQTLLEAERRLLADVSHELRSPLARLGLAIELARSAHSPGPALDRCRKELDRLSSLVGELLQLTRAEGDPQSRHLEPRNLASLLADIAADAAIEADHRQVRLTVEAQPLQCTVDAELIRRAVDNVLRNALRFAPASSEVKVELGSEGRDAVIRVRDFGPGVPDETLPRLFDPFFRVETDRSRLSGGAGLGLAIARRAIAAHGGRIAARNAAPGLQIEMRIPL